MQIDNFNEDISIDDLEKAVKDMEEQLENITALLSMTKWLLKQKKIQGNEEPKKEVE